MRVNQLLGMGACFAMLALTGCMDKDVYDPGKDPTVLKPESEYFDFTTTTNVAFEVNYGEIGSNALIEIFTEYPISYNETGSFVIQRDGRCFAGGSCYTGEVKFEVSYSQ